MPFKFEGKENVLHLCFRKLLVNSLQSGKAWQD